METEIFAALTQFGVAGLIGWMWLTERRAGSDRERQLGEAHERLMEQRTQLEALMTVVRENTRAVTALESAQRAVATALERLAPLPLPRERMSVAQATDR